MKKKRFWSWLDSFLQAMERIFDALCLIVAGVRSFLNFGWGVGRLMPSGGLMTASSTSRRLTLR
jgi:hypothetical protein|tara:strand:- start:203 stop:394 length:192 start_codon:yes stop_codon:yes gene_type:complete